MTDIKWNVHTQHVACLIILQRFHLYSVVNTSSRCAFSFAVMENNVGSELQSAVESKLVWKWLHLICHHIPTYPLIHAVVTVQWAAGKMNTYLCLWKCSHCRLGGHTLTQQDTETYEDTHTVGRHYCNPVSTLTWLQRDESSQPSAASICAHTHTRAHSFT